MFMRFMSAERFANNVDVLLHERRCNLPASRETSNWIAGLDDSLCDLLAHPSRGRELAKAFLEPRSSRQAEGTRAAHPNVRCVPLDGEHAQRRPQTLSDGHRRTLPECRRKRGLAGDKRGMQPPVTPRTDSHKKTLALYEVRKNATFAEVVNVLNSHDIVLRRHCSVLAVRPK